MFVDAPGERRVERKGIWEGPSLPTGVRKKRGEDEIEQQSGIMKFTIATRKGNKIQVRMLLPLSILYLTYWICPRRANCLSLWTQN